MELPIKQLKIVRYEKAFPDLSKKEFYALKESIERWGIIEPIVINQNNVIICGKERYRAALLLGIEKVPVTIRKTNGNAEIEKISLEENLKRKHFPQYKEAKKGSTLYELKSVKKKGERSRKKKNYAISRKSITEQTDISEKHISRYHSSAKLIPELSKLLDEGKINQEGASLYATLPFENQKKICSILVDNFSNDKSMKMEDQCMGIGECIEDEKTIARGKI